MSELYDILIAAHQGSWALLIIAFLITFTLYRTRKITGGTVVKMILRLFYLVMIISGAGLLALNGFPVYYLIKTIIALVVIGFMEMALEQAKQGKKKWTGFIAALVLVLLVVIIGYAG